MIEWIVSSSVLTMLVIGLRYALRGRIGLRLQYALWVLVALRLLIPVSFGTSPVSVGNLTQKVVQAPDSIVLPQIENVTVIEAVEPHLPDWSALMLTAWRIGVGVFALVFFGANVHFWLKLRKSREKFKTQLCKLPIYISSEVDTPCLFGLVHPAIYMPHETVEDPVILRHAIAHELTHQLHGDSIWSLLRVVCLTLHWYNPLVWWAVFLSAEDAELACDEATIARLGESERASYGQTLIKITCQTRPKILLTATTMNGSIKERIWMIAKKPKTAVCTLIAVVLIGATAVGCTFTGANEALIEAVEPTTDHVTLAIDDEVQNVPTTNDETNGQTTEHITLNVDDESQNEKKAYSFADVPEEMKEAAEGYAKTVMGEGYTAYKVIEWGICEICEDGDALSGHCTFSYVPEDPNALMAGNCRKDESEGRWRCSFCFVLEKKDDVWQGAITGTGNYPLSMMSHRGHWVEDNHIME